MQSLRIHQFHFAIFAICAATVAAGAQQIPTYAVEFFGRPAGVSTIPSVTGLNDQGRFTITALVGSNTHAWVGGPLQSLEALPIPPDFDSCAAADIDNSGRIIGTVMHTSTGRGLAAIWTPVADGYSLQLLNGLPGHQYSTAIACNNVGDIIGTSQRDAASPTIPVWFQPNGDVVDLTSIGYPATLSAPTDVNDQRQVCADRFRFQLDTELLEDLGLPDVPSGSTRYNFVRGIAINDFGQIAAYGILATSSGPIRCLRYTDGIGWQVVDLVQVSFGGPFDINNSGTVIMDTVANTARNLLAYSDANGQYLPTNHLESQAYYWAVRNYGGRLNNNGQIAGLALNTNNSDQRFGIVLLTPVGEQVIPGDMTGNGHLETDDLCVWESSPTDLNGDGSIDAADEQYLIELLAQRGYSVQDCNQNGAWDYCDIASGAADDVNHDAIPDDCQPDCNGDGIPDAADADCNANGVPDSCEIAAGTARDCNFNGIPDECDGGLVESVGFDYPAPSTPLFPNSIYQRTEWVAVNGEIADVNFRLHMDFRIGDTAVRLSHAGVTATLIDRPGFPSQSGSGFSELGFNVVLDDEGTGGLIESRGHYGGVFDPIQSPPSYRPNQSLSRFDGLGAGGDWTIEIETYSTSPVAMLYGWGVTITTAPAPVQRCAGDMNCDGSVNNFDIDPFVLALVDRLEYQAAYPQCEWLLADVNGDGMVNNFDIDSFVELLSGG